MKRMQPPSKPLLLVGASARSAAFSASLAGYQPAAIDLFADVDLDECCPVELWDYQTESLLGLARRLPSGPWLYSGGLENRPHLVQLLATERQLYGNGCQTLAEVRNPWKLAAVLGKHACRVAKLSEPLGARVARKWVRKPLRSAGGSGVQRLIDARSASPMWKASYLQEYLVGPSYGAVYVAYLDGTVFLGVTKQLVGAAWTGGTGFHYCGSIGPVHLAEAAQCEIVRLGAVVAAEFDLRGIFGIDVVVNQDGVWTLEVNPRYTASVEILERAADVAAIQLHVAACEGQTRSNSPTAMRPGCFGKAIVFARRRLIVPANFTALVSRRNARRSWHSIADIPRVGSVIDRGRPVTTVFAAAPTMELVELKLRMRAHEVQRVLQC